MSDNSQSKSKLHYFQFDPSDFLDVLMMSDADAGKRFKTLIVRLSKNEAPADSAEAKMISSMNNYRNAQRERVMRRWHKDESAVAAPVQSEPPARKVIRMRPPQLEDVYDFCTANKFPEPFGREWFEYQDNKGWNTLKANWQKALRGFCEIKMKTIQ